MQSIARHLPFLKRLPAFPSPVGLPLRVFLCAPLLALTTTAAAAEIPLTPFQASYHASVGGFNADAQRRLIPQQEDQYRYESSITLKLLGKTLTQVQESSLLGRRGRRVVPEHYLFRQTGIGSRQRQVTFDWDERIAESIKDDRQFDVTLPMNEPVFDELSLFVEIRRQLLEGEEDIQVQAVNGNGIQIHHYRVIGREPVQTDMGAFNTIRLEKVRGEDSERRTEIWMATDWDYLLVKLYQREKGGRDVEISVSEATVDGRPVLPLERWPEQ